MFVFSRFMRYFLEVAREGSIRKASETLHVSASAIDRQILAAESELGVPLFERLPSGLKPTAAGELLLTATGRWRREFERLHGQIDDLVGLRRGHVRIAIIDALARGFIARAVRDVRQDFPGITVELKVLDNVDVQGVVQRGEVDFGLMLAPRSSKDIIVQNHRDIVLGVVTQPDHQLAAMPGIRFSRCADYPIVAPAEPLALCDQVNALQAATGVVLSLAISSDNIQMIKSLVKDGVGVGILTSLDAMQEVRLGELTFTPLTDSVLRPMPLALCVGQARQLSHAARLLLGRIEQALLQAEIPADRNLAVPMAGVTE
jgi:DNA-binding transcriptional LysR family regulator